jgi:hypothetical protein
MAEKLQLTLFFPRRLMSLMSDSCASLRSYLDNRSLNSSIGKFIISFTFIGIFIARARFSSLFKCSSSDFRPIENKYDQI